MVLYVLAVGQVKGFAFTLGMSTVLDLIVVFLVTHPLLALASNSRLFQSPAWSGLGKVARQAPPSTGRGGGAAPTREARSGARAPRSAGDRKRAAGAGTSRDDGTERPRRTTTARRGDDR